MLTGIVIVVGSLAAGFCFIGMIQKVREIGYSKVEV